MEAQFLAVELGKLLSLGGAENGEDGGRKGENPEAFLRMFGREA